MAIVRSETSYYPLWQVAGAGVKRREATRKAHRPTQINSGNSLLALSCPSAARCTTVDDVGQQVTLDPAVHAIRRPHEVDQAPDGLACPSRTQCTVVDESGGEVTFDPGARTAGRGVEFTGSEFPLGVVACPSVQQCTTVEDFSELAITFRPRSGAIIKTWTLDAGGDDPTGLACPSINQCTAVDSAGALTFNPRTGRTIRLAARDSGLRVACPSLRQCTSVYSNGESTFNPRTGSAIKKARIPSDDLVDIGCASASECVVIDGGPARAFLGDPLTGRWRAQRIARASSLTAVACPAASECVAVDSTGQVFVGRG